MIINETTLGDLCARVARGDEDARRDFDRHVAPVVEAIVGRWLRQQRPGSTGHPSERGVTEGLTAEARATTLLPKVAAAVCAQMVADAAGRRRMRRPRQPTP